MLCDILSIFIGIDVEYDVQSHGARAPPNHAGQPPSAACPGKGGQGKRCGNPKGKKEEKKSKSDDVEIDVPRMETQDTMKQTPTESMPKVWSITSLNRFL